MSCNPCEEASKEFSAKVFPLGEDGKKIPSEPLVSKKKQPKNKAIVDKYTERFDTWLDDMENHFGAEITNSFLEHVCKKVALREYDESEFAECPRRIMIHK